MGKMVFSWMIKKDSKIPGTVVRASTFPEQLGRISYLLTDKTGMISFNCKSLSVKVTVFSWIFNDYLQLQRRLSFKNVGHFLFIFSN